MARHAPRNETRNWSPTIGRASAARHRRASQAGAAAWIWGWHAVLAALANPVRGPLERLVATSERARQLGSEVTGAPAPDILDGPAIARLLPAGATHQGLALKIAPLEPVSIAALATPPTGVLVMLDQVTDPQNVGAILRSAAAFGARGVIVQDRHAPQFTGALAKAAAGAVDAIPHARVVNLARALDELADLGWRAVGLAGEAQASLAAVLDRRPTVLVLGSEGQGLRRLVGEHCDALARIPLPGGFASLNVSTAAAVALYQATQVLD